MKVSVNNLLSNVVARKAVGLVFAALVMNLTLNFKTAGQKLKADEVVAKHLESIGTTENRAAAKNYLLIGATKFKILQQVSVLTEGRSVFASESGKMLLAMTFKTPEYPHERIYFNGGKISVGFIAPGIRSQFGNYLVLHEQIVDDGLLGGALFKSWSLANSDQDKTRIKMDGTKKINGAECYVLNYETRGTADFKIKLYFDAQTFRHVRSEYRRLFSTQLGAVPELSSRLNEARQILTEDFSDFKTENNLSLPRSYQMQLTTDGQSGTRLYTWDVNFTQVLLNQKFAPDFFNADAK